MNKFSFPIVTLICLLTGCIYSQPQVTPNLSQGIPILGTSNVPHNGLTGSNNGSNYGPFSHNYDISQHSTAINLETKLEDEILKEGRLRAEAIRDVATTYGVQLGIFQTSRKINQELKRTTSNLSRIFDFQMLMISGPDGVKVRPPVISEAKETWEVFDEGKTIRVADLVYEIITQAQFTSVAPTWQEYLITVFEEPNLPYTVLQPNSAEEESAWNKWERAGWDIGKQQAHNIFESNLNRLNRDFQGMIRYKILVEEGRVNPAVIAQGVLGNTGDGQNMRVNDRAIRITRDPELELDSSKWLASPTYLDVDGKVYGIPNPKIEFDTTE